MYICVYIYTMYIYIYIYISIHSFASMKYMYIYRRRHGALEPVVPEDERPRADGPHGREALRSGAREHVVAQIAAREHRQCHDGPARSLARHRMDRGRGNPLARTAKSQLSGAEALTAKRAPVPHQHEGASPGTSASAQRASLPHPRAAVRRALRSQTCVYQRGVHPPWGRTL